MPRPVKKVPGSAGIDDATLVALLIGAPLGLEYRRHGLFYCNPKSGFPADERALLRRLWHLHREHVITRFQAAYGPDLMPWGYWAFESQAAHDEAPYHARWAELNKQWEAEHRHRWENGGREAALARIAAKTAARAARGDAPRYTSTPKPAGISPATNGNFQ